MAVQLRFNVWLNGVSTMDTNDFFFGYRPPDEYIKKSQRIQLTRDICYVMDDLSQGTKNVCNLSNAGHPL